MANKDITTIVNVDGWAKQSCKVTAKATNPKVDAPRLGAPATGHNWGSCHSVGSG